MRLLFPQGASNLHICSGEADQLATGRFSGRSPAITSTGAVLVVKYQRGSGRSHGELRLHPDVTWTIESHRGLSNLTADLTGLKVAGLRVLGGVSRLWLSLPKTESPIRVEIEGGAERVTILRPEDIGAVLEIQDGASKLTFDGQEFGAVSGYLNVSSETTDLPGEYRITTRRGVSRFAVDTSPTNARIPQSIGLLA